MEVVDEEEDECVAEELVEVFVSNFVDVFELTLVLDEDVVDVEVAVDEVESAVEAALLI